MLTSGRASCRRSSAARCRRGSRELFVLVALTAAVGTALAAGALFGVSLALGAFLAGVVVGESPFSHQVGADLLPFREAFAVLFFVSVGMLVNPDLPRRRTGSEVLASQRAHHRRQMGADHVASGLLFAYPARTTLVVAAGRSQIGEFSFILGQSGLALGLHRPGSVLADPRRRDRLDHGQPADVQADRHRPSARCAGGRALWRLLDRPRAEIVPQPAKACATTS